MTEQRQHTPKPLVNESQKHTKPAASKGFEEFRLIEEGFPLVGGRYAF